MCQFKIVPLEEQQYDVIIFSESYDSPFSCLEEITEEVKKNNIRDARVLFDALLSIGNTSERFAEASFVGEKFVLDSFKFVEIKKNNMIRQFCAHFFNENSNILEYSILTPIQKELLRKGATI
ncbi:MAG: type II toxin-antitoxin system RnlB family antitoxin [Lachnospiraceae bacterium]|nr:type II toxin-antitoxin system RnlB family antitoxin [Lachnospiraceae bacterium]